MRRESQVRFCEGGGVRFPSATRLVILCRRGKAEEALQRLREIMGKLKLTVNEEKTRICKVPEGEFDLPQLHVRADVFGEDRKGPYRLPALKEERPARGREDPRADRPIGNMAGDHDAGGRVNRQFRINVYSLRALE